MERTWHASSSSTQKSRRHGWSRSITRQRIDTDRWVCKANINKNKEWMNNSGTVYWMDFCQNECASFHWGVNESFEGESSCCRTRATRAGCLRGRKWQLEKKIKNSSDHQIRFFFLCIHLFNTPSTAIFKLFSKSSENLVSSSPSFLTYDFSRSLQEYIYRLIQSEPLETIFFFACAC